MIHYIICCCVCNVYNIQTEEKRKQKVLMGYHLSSSPPFTLILLNDLPANRSNYKSIKQQKIYHHHRRNKRSHNFTPLQKNTTLK